MCGVTHLLFSHRGNGGGGGGGGTANLAGLHHVHHLLEVVHEPVRLVAHRVAVGDAAESDEGGGGGLGLSVRRAVADHNHGLVVASGLDFGESTRLAAVGGGGLVGVEALVGSVFVEEDGVGDNVGLVNVELGSNGLNHDAEAAGDEVDGDVLVLKSLDEVSHGRRELERVLLKAFLNGRTGGLNESKTGSEGVLEFGGTVHGLGGPRGHLVALAEVGGEDVDALLVDDRGVNVKANTVGD